MHDNLHLNSHSSHVGCVPRTVWSIGAQSAPYIFLDSGFRRNDGKKFFQSSKISRVRPTHRFVPFRCSVRRAHPTFSNKVGLAPRLRRGRRRGANGLCLARRVQSAGADCAPAAATCVAKPLPPALRRHTSDAGAATGSPEHFRTSCARLPGFALGAATTKWWIRTTLGLARIRKPAKLVKSGNRTRDSRFMRSVLYPLSYLTLLDV